MTSCVDIIMCYEYESILVLNTKIARGQGHPIIYTYEMLIIHASILHPVVDLTWANPASRSVSILLPILVIPPWL